MSSIPIDTLLHLSNEKAKTVKVYVSKILSDNSYLVIDEKSHCVLSVKNELKIANGIFMKITNCKSDEKGGLSTTEKSESYNCSPFKCFQMTKDMIELYQSEASPTTHNEKLENPVSLKEVDLIPGKV